MKPTSKTLSSAGALFAALLLACFLNSARAEIEPAARARAKEVAAKLTGAKTIRLTAKHQLDPRLGVGSRLEKGPLEITMKRPNQFHAIQKAGAETREIAYDGKTLCMMHPEMKHHAMESLRASSIEEFSDKVDERFGFRPPIAELLANDLASTLFLHVTSAKLVENQWLGFARCDRLHLEQEGMALDLWVGAKDGLPRRMLLTFTDLPNHPTWDIRLKKWEFNSPVDESLFSKRPAADSLKVKMLKSR